jgi:hypothetical protein
VVCPQSWLVGSNYIPEHTTNQLEIWQSQSFDAAQIDEELRWAEEVETNAMRVFLHDLVWHEDAAGAKKRMGRRPGDFLPAPHPAAVCVVRFMLRFEPETGSAASAHPRVRNLGWVQSPGRSVARSHARRATESIRVGWSKPFANDSRGRLGRDVWNEASNTNDGSYSRLEPKDKPQFVEGTLPKVFSWARQAHPSQPLTSGVWRIDFANGLR